MQLVRQKEKKKMICYFCAEEGGQVILPDGINVEVNGPVVTASYQTSPHRVR
jgi:hypothetical protein